MAKGKAQAQAQTQKTAGITHIESSTLLLKPSEDEEAATLRKWVEEGVLHAVEQGYLRTMYFGVARDAAATQLLEEYIFSFSYGDDGGVTLELDAGAAGGRGRDRFSSADAKARPARRGRGGGARARGRRLPRAPPPLARVAGSPPPPPRLATAAPAAAQRKAPPGVDVVRYQIVRLMRLLVQVCQTLDAVPDERFLFIKLTYHDHTPDSYEPPNFHAVAEDGIGHFARRPFAMDVGAVDTRHHTMSGLSDQEMEDAAAPGGGCPTPCDEAHLAMLVASEPQRLPAPTQPPHAAADSQLLIEPTLAPPGSAAGADHAAGAGDASDDDETCDTRGDSAAPAPPPRSAQPLRSSPSAGASGGAGYERVRAFVLARAGGTLGFVDLLAAFYELTPEQLTRAVEGMGREGLIKPGAQRDTYVVVAAAPAPPAPAAPKAFARGGAGRGGGGAAAAADAGAEAAGDTSQLAGGGGAARPRGAALRQGERAISDMMTGLSMGGGGGGASAAAAAAARRGQRERAGAQRARGCVCARALEGAARSPRCAPPPLPAALTRSPRRAAGSDASGAPPAAPRAPPFAAQTDAAGADEPSVQLPQDREHRGIWFEGSQQSFRGPAAAAAQLGVPAAPPGGAGAGAGEAPPRSRLRKASYVNSPIHQRSGKRDGARRGAGAGEPGAAAVHKTANKAARKPTGGGGRAVRTAAMK
ncbi:PAIR2 [Scenedesmus sp. PABB004]|nr:PAIR2 [Scenedesmus sp. PABB004]